MEYEAEISGTFPKKVGEAVVLLTNPKEPALYIFFGVPLIILAVMFVILGMYFGLISPMDISN